MSLIKNSLIGLLLAILFSGVTSAATNAQETFIDGTYQGIGRADGMVLKISTLDGILQGTFTETNGTQSVIRLEVKNDNIAVGTIRVQGTPIFVLLEMVDAGRVVLGTVPLDELGQPISAAANGFDFNLARAGRF